MQSYRSTHDPGVENLIKYILNEHRNHYNQERVEHGVLWQMEMEEEEDRMIVHQVRDQSRTDRSKQLANIGNRIEYTGKDTQNQRVSQAQDGIENNCDDTVDRTDLRESS
jgi:hypothetical protein